jgi:hypothetical protein
MAFLALVDAPLSSESIKFPVFSLLTGNFETETGSLETASSSGESGANRNWPAGTSLSSAEAVQAPSSTGGPRVRIHLPPVARNELLRLATNYTRRGDHLDGRTS